MIKKENKDKEDLQYNYLFFICYIGLGGTSNYNLVYLNEKNPQKKSYNLQKNLIVDDDFKNLKRTGIIMYFDNSQENVPQELGNIRELQTRIISDQTDWRKNKTLYMFANKTLAGVPSFH